MFALLRLLLLFEQMINEKLDGIDFVAVAVVCWLKWSEFRLLWRKTCKLSRARHKLVLGGRLPASDFYQAATFFIASFACVVCGARDTTRTK